MSPSNKKLRTERSKPLAQDIIDLYFADGHYDQLLSRCNDIMNSALPKTQSERASVWREEAKKAQQDRIKKRALKEEFAQLYHQLKRAVKKKQKQVAPAMEEKLGTLPSIETLAPHMQRMWHVLPRLYNGKSFIRNQIGNGREYWYRLEMLQARALRAGEPPKPTKNFIVRDPLFNDNPVYKFYTEKYPNNVDKLKNLATLCGYDFYDIPTDNTLLDRTKQKRTN